MEGIRCVGVFRSVWPTSLLRSSPTVYTFQDSEGTFAISILVRMTNGGNLPIVKSVFHAAPNEALERSNYPIPPKLNLGVNFQTHPYG